VFGIGVAELLLIFVVALLVLGPDQLPGVARTLAKFMGEFRRAGEDLRLNIMSASNDVGLGKVSIAKQIEGAIARAGSREPEVIDVEAASSEATKTEVKPNG
jgi:sec-independent protein translocase protein TatB